MFAAVIPAVKLPRGTAFFDYRIPEHLLEKVVPGTVVTVLWRNAHVPGLVVRVNAATDVPEKRIKDIAGVAVEHAASRAFVSLVLHVAEECCSAPGTTLYSILPAFPKRVLKKMADDITSHDNPTPDAPGNASLRRYADVREKMSATLEAMTAHDAAHAQVLICIPHLDDIPGVANALRENGGWNIREYHGNVAAGAQFEVWRDALSGAPGVYVGTRGAAFLPFSRLAAAIVHESESRDHRQYDTNPRYDARDVLRFRAEREGARLHIMSHAPRVEDVLAIGERREAYTESAGADPDTSIAGLTRSEKSSLTLLSLAAEQAIESALQSGKRVLIFHNRRADAAALICQDCRAVMVCSRCGITASISGASFLCGRCGQRDPLPTECPSCRGIRLRRVGMGGRALADEHAKQFPEARVALTEAFGGAFPDADIVISTVAAIHDLSERFSELPNFGLVVVTRAEDLLVHSGFRTMESAWQTIRELRDIAASCGARCILQSESPDDPRTQRLLSDFWTFSTEELRERRAAKYPPATSVVTLTSLDAVREKAQAKSAALKKEFAPLTKDAVDVAGPFWPPQPFRHGKWRSIIALRAAAIPAPIKAKLASLSDETLIDTNPETLT